MASAAKPDFSGWLTKQSDWLKDWRSRFFVLQGDKLTFSKGEGDEPHGSINLRECLTVKSADEKTGRKHSFEVATAERTYYCCADSEKIKDAWIGAIGRAIVKYAASAPADGDDDEDDDDYGDDAGGL